MLNKEIFVLNLFGFFQINPGSTKYIYKEKISFGNPFSYCCRIYPLTIELEHSEETFKESRLKIVDPDRNKIIYVKKFPHDKLIVDLIDNREKYFKMSFAYHVSRIINQYNILESESLDILIEDLFIYKVCNEFERSQWGGVDKDNLFTTIVNYDYFIIYKGYIVVDVYIKSLLPKSYQKVTMFYKDYKPLFDTKGSTYWLEKADGIISEIFKSTYDHKAHQNYLNSRFT